MRRALPFFPALAFFFLFATACTNSSTDGNGDGKNGKDEGNGKANKNMVEKDLSDKGLKLIAQVPKKDPQKGRPPVKVGISKKGGVQLKGGDAFGMRIISGAPVMSMKEKKNGIKSMNQALKTEFLKEKEDLLLYKFSVPGSDKEMYHFYMVADVGGQKYVVRSLEDGEYSKGQVELMIRSAKSFKPKKGDKSA